MSSASSCLFFANSSNRGSALAATIARRLGKHKDEQKAVAKALRDEGKTQKETAEIVGVSRVTIHNWENEEKEEVSTNVNSDIGTQKTPAESQKPDNRKKTKKEQDAEIIQRVKDGESQRQVAADFVQPHAGAPQRRPTARPEKKIKSRLTHLARKRDCIV